MYPDALSDSLSRLCDETGLTYEAASRHCRCSSQYFRAVIRRKSVPSIAVLENLCNGFSAFPICPPCQSTMEREYQAFRDRCGQRLSWRGFRQTAILMPPSETRRLF